VQHCSLREGSVGCEHLPIYMAREQAYTLLSIDALKCRVVVKYDCQSLQIPFKEVKDDEVCW